MLSDCTEILELILLPGVIAIQLGGHRFGHARRDPHGGSCIEQKRASSSAQNIVKCPGHLMSNRPDDIGFSDRQ